MRSIEIRTRGRAVALLWVLLAAAVWGSSGMWIRWATAAGGLSPVGLAFWRDSMTCLCLLIFAGVRWRRQALTQLAVARRDLPWLAAMGIFSIGSFHVLWNISVVINGVAAATVLQYLAPIFVTVAAWWLWREPLTWRKLAAAGLVLAGAALMTGLYTTEVHLTTWGVLVALATALGFGSMSIFGKKLVGVYPPWVVLAYAFGIGASVLAPFFWLGGPPWGIARPAWLPFLCLVFLPTLGGFSLYTLALAHLSAGVTAIVAAVEIFFALCFAYLILGERLLLGQWAGAVLVMVGVALVSWPRRAAVHVT